MPWPRNWRVPDPGSSPKRTTGTFASFKGAKSFSFFFQKEAFVSCSFLKKRTKKLLLMGLMPGTVGTRR
jgi:hypothetical protein